MTKLKAARLLWPAGTLVHIGQGQRTWVITRVYRDGRCGPLMAQLRSQHGDHTGHTPLEKLRALCADPV